MKRTAASIAITLALFVAPASALASGNSTNQQYSKNVQSVQDKSASRTPSTTGTPSAVNDTKATTTTSAGDLPFTGLDLGALGAGAVVLLGAGMVLRRSTDRR